MDVQRFPPAWTPSESAIPLVAYKIASYSTVGDNSLKSFWKTVSEPGAWREFNAEYTARLDNAITVKLAFSLSVAFLGAPPFADSKVQSALHAAAATMSLAGIILKLFSPTIQVQAENINDTDLVTSKAKIFKRLLSLRTPRMLGSLSLFFFMAALLLPLPLTLVLLLVAIIFCAAVLEFGGHLPTWLVVVAIVLLVLAVIAFVILSFSEY